MILFDATCSFPHLTNEPGFVKTAYLEVTLIRPNAEGSAHFTTFGRGGAGMQFGYKETLDR